MLSWTWEYTATSVVSGLREWCELKAKNDLSKVRVWQCALCNNQYRMEDLKRKGKSESDAVLGDIFERRIVSAGFVLALILPWDNPTYIKRIWCIYEVWKVENLNIPLEITMPVSERNSFKAAIEHHCGITTDKKDHGCGIIIKIKQYLGITNKDRYSGIARQIITSLSKIRVQDATARDQATAKDILSRINSVMNPDELNWIVQDRLTTWYATELFDLNELEALSKLLAFQRDRERERERERL